MLCLYEIEYRQRNCENYFDNDIGTLDVKGKVHGLIKYICQPELFILTLQ